MLLLCLIISVLNINFSITNEFVVRWFEQSVLQDRSTHLELLKDVRCCCINLVLSHWSSTSSPLNLHYPNHDILYIEVMISWWFHQWKLISSSHTKLSWSILPTYDNSLHSPILSRVELQNYQSYLNKRLVYSLFYV